MSRLGDRSVASLRADVCEPTEHVSDAGKWDGPLRGDCGFLQEFDLVRAGMVEVTLGLNKLLLRLINRPETMELTRIWASG